MIFGKNGEVHVVTIKILVLVQLFCDKKNFLIIFLKNILGYVTAYDKGYIWNMKEVSCVS
jgi:hypothetical protein